MEVARGAVPGFSIVRKFGRNPSIDTTFAPVSLIGDYPTPQASGALPMRVKSGGNANDTADGTGAREVTIEGLDDTGALASEAVATAGASASSATTTAFMRVFRSYVSASGFYGTSAQGSHAATITIENTAGVTYAEMSATNFQRSQSQIGVYSVPLGYKAHVLGLTISVSSTKAVDFVLMQRESILDLAPPYKAIRVNAEYTGVTDSFVQDFREPYTFNELTDVGYMARVASSTADASVDFSILLEKT